MAAIRRASTGAIAPRASGSLDLPAIVLTPSDVVDAGGPGFGLSFVDYSSPGWRTLGDVAEGSVAGNLLNGIPTLSRLNFDLAQTGWERQYRQIIAKPKPIDPESVHTAVFSEVAEFADDTGADEALTLLMDGGQDVSFDDGSIGDRTEIRRDLLLNVGARVVVAFRAGNLLGIVSVVRFGGSAEPGLEFAVELAERLHERIEEAVSDPEPGLAEVTLHLSTVSSPSEYESYRRLNGEDFADYGETPEQTSEASVPFGTAVSVYQTLSRPVGAEESVLPEYTARVYRFDNTSDARAWLEDIPGGVAEDVANSNGTFSAELINGAATIGDESLTYLITQERNGATTQGYRVYLRLGVDIARLQFDAVWEPDLESVEWLAREQATCFEASGCTGPVQLPALLQNRLCPAPSGMDSFRDIGVPAASAGHDGRISDQTQQKPAGAGSPLTVWQVGSVGSNLAGPVESNETLVYASSRIDPAGIDLYTLTAVDSSSGAPRWCVTTGEISSRPAAADEFVYAMAKEVTGDARQPFVVALDATTGMEQWRFSVGWMTEDHQTELVVEDDVVYAGTGLGALYALDAATGEPRWMFEIDDMDVDIDQLAISAPAIAGDALYLAAGRTIYAVDAETGELRWEYTGDSEDVFGAPIVAGDLVYGGGAGVVALDAASGELAWRFTAENSSAVQLAVADSALIAGAGGQSGDPALLYALDPISGEERWHLEHDGSLTGITVSDGIVYAGVSRSNGEPGALIALAATDGQQLWSDEIDAEVITPLIDGAHLWVGSESADGSISVQLMTSLVGGMLASADVH